MYVHASADIHVCIQTAFAYPPAKFQECFQCLIN